MKFESIGDKQNQAKLIREILMAKLGNQLLELEDDYGISADVLEGLSMKLFVDSDKKVLWKAGKTRFTKAFDKEVIKLIDENVIDFDDLGFLMYLASKYTGHEDNYIRKDDKYLSKKELIADISSTKKASESYLKKKILSLEKKNLILSESHPKDKRNKVFYLTPHVFYKGKFMDNRVKEELLNISKDIHNDIKKLNEEGKINIPLDVNFINKDNDNIINEIMEYLHAAS